MFRAKRFCSLSLPVACTCRSLFRPSLPLFDRAGAPPSPPSAVNEDRVARWCKRLWALTMSETSGTPANTRAPVLPSYASSSRSGALDVPLSRSEHYAQLSAMVDKAVHNLSSGASTATTNNNNNSGEEDPLVILMNLQKSVRGEKSRIPGVVVESVWTAFDTLVPPHVQASPKKLMKATYERNFYGFVATLNEIDFDVSAVVNSASELNQKLSAYTTALKASSGDGDGPHGEKERALTTSRGAALNETMMRTRAELMRACFEVRNAGAPLYYTWLRSTASTTNGLRRLMNFRMLLHFFESQCRQEIKQMKIEMAALLKKEPTTEQKNSLQSLETALHFWKAREMEIGLLDGSLSMLFHDFFSKEYLVMEELTWYSTPPSLLDQVMSAESVHPFTGGLNDMRHRLQPTPHRHLFAFLHPAVVEEPLIAVQVALTKGIASSVDSILHRPTPLAALANTSKAALKYRGHEAAKVAGATGSLAARDGGVDTAIFYSINSAQSALRGMDMGNRLIKRVVHEIDENLNTTRKAHQLVPIERFSTLSPIPLFVRWLEEQSRELLEKMKKTETITNVDCMRSGVFGKAITAEEEEGRFWGSLRAAVDGFLQRHAQINPEACATLAETARRALTDAAACPGDAKKRLAANATSLAFLVRLFKDAANFPTPPSSPSPSGSATTCWWWDHEFTMALEAPLLRAVAVYLCQVKRGDKKNQKAKRTAKNMRISDPVGNFHVSNGATIYRVNFLGNTTPQGSRESGCVMVNYLYKMETVSSNVTLYETEQTVALGDFMKDLLREEADTTAAPAASKL